MLKATIVLLLVAVMVSLFSGLVFLVRDDSSRRRVLAALTVRVSLTAVLVLLIGWGFYSGELKPSFAF
ncbi:twin transmembrane helix small protein [Stutzerimonas urumqiensis]|uniref:twin transmembrane helix small protein n=1 Tax=Stutzerimonas urumqiensis TaxID=638269 RepID=UPI000EAFFEDE|nr:twin transmembrane helix small protein [Stutzerimonas urumqiensis]